MLGGMALKWKWREQMRAAGRQTDKPNMVMGINVQICWDKFCTYWDIEPRFVPMEQGRYIMDADGAVALCDENTIGVVAIMGSTFEGSYEPVKQLNDALDKLEKDKGLDIPIHVDGASGGFVAPFLQPELQWDFRVPRVQSINASGHKYGLVYPGIGWIIWRNHEALHKELVFSVNYLGGEMPTFAINFSRPGNYVLAQYYNFLRLGFDGYKRIRPSRPDGASTPRTPQRRVPGFRPCSRRTPSHHFHPPTEPRRPAGARRRGRVSAHPAGGSRVPCLSRSSRSVREGGDP